MTPEPPALEGKGGGGGLDLGNGRNQQITGPGLAIFRLEKRRTHHIIIAIITATLINYHRTI